MGRGGGNARRHGKDGDEDAQDETAWAAHKQELREKWRLSEERVATLVDMQHVAAG